MSDPLFEAVADVVAQTFGCDRAAVQPQTQAFDVDGWDSLSHVYFILNVEQALNVKLPIDAVMNCADVGALVEALRTELAKAKA